MRYLFPVVLVSLAYGQAPAPAEEQKKIHLEGRVLNVAGEPLSKATLILQPASRQLPANVPHSALLQMSGTSIVATDDTGAFQIDNVEPGSYQLRAERAGFVPHNYGARNVNGAATPITVKAGDWVTKLDLRLTPHGAIAGRILDVDGDPVPGVQISASRYVYSGGKRQLRPEGTAKVSDDQGNYRISGLQPGRYYVHAQVPPNQKKITRDATNVSTYFPNSLDMRGAVAVDAGAGAEVLADMRLRREKSFNIRGKVVNAQTGEAANGASMLLIPAGVDSDALLGLVQEGIQTDREGKFEIRGVIPGEYTLSGGQKVSALVISGFGAGVGGAASFRGLAVVGEGVPLTGRQPVIVSDEDLLDVIIGLSPGSAITGSVQVEGVTSIAEFIKALPPTKVAGMEPPPGAVIGFGIRLSPVQDVTASLIAANFDSNGAFRLNGAAPGKYHAILNGVPRGYYVKSITYPGQNPMRDALDLSEGGGQMSITLGKGTGEISGTVTDKEGARLSGVMVTLWPQVATQAHPVGGVRTTIADQNGAFKFADLVPGEYRLAAFEELPETGLAEYFPFVNAFSSEAASVKLVENGSQSSQLKPVGRDKIQAETAKLP